VLLLTSTAFALMKRVTLILFLFILFPIPALPRGYTYDELYDYHSKEGFIFIVEMCSSARKYNSRGLSHWDTRNQSLIRKRFESGLERDLKKQNISKNTTHITNIWMSVIAKHMNENCPDVW
jgi:hypothetical protein